MPDATPLYGLRYPNDTDTLKAAVKDIPRFLAEDIEGTMGGLRGESPNAIANSSFEVDTAGWGINSGTLASVADGVTTDGIKAAAVTPSSSATQALAYSPAIPCNGSETWTGAMWVRCVGGTINGYQLAMRSYDALGASVGDVTSVIPNGQLSATEFRRVVVQGPTQPDATSVRLMLRTPTGLTAGVQACRFDSAFLGRGVAAPALQSDTVGPKVLANADLSNSFTTTGSNTSYRKIGPAVHLTMQVNRASAWAANTTLFTLPVGFRPSRDVYFIGSDTAGGLMTVRIYTTGVVSVVNASSNGIVASTMFFL